MLKISSKSYKCGSWLRCFASCDIVDALFGAAGTGTDTGTADDADDDADDITVSALATRCETDGKLGFGALFGDGGGTAVVVVVAAAADTDGGVVVGNDADDIIIDDDDGGSDVDVVRIDGD
jgi:hypothetical protein